MALSDAETIRRTYWRENRRWMLILGSIWFVVSLGCGVLWVEPLNQIRLGGFKLGFWFAQQGAIYRFIILIFTLRERDGAAGESALALRNPRHESD